MFFQIIDLILLSISLGVDCLSISLAVGAFFPSITKNERLKLLCCFMAFHYIMLTIGWACGSNIIEYIDTFDHWVIFAFLTFIGIKMIVEAVKGEDEEEIRTDFFAMKNMIAISLITSLDALAIGFSFAFIKISIWIPNLVISLTVGVMTLIGLPIGKKIGDKFSEIAKIFAGIALILIGVKVVLESYGVI